MRIVLTDRCLCGSEQSLPDLQNLRLFLSCLCGSEPESRLMNRLALAVFLSCLCGSERTASAICTKTNYF